MLVHNVLFWLRKNLEGDELTEFRMGLESLKSIEGVEGVHIGSPAEVAERPPLISNYDYCLTVIFKDIAAHDTYQADPIHKTFIEEFSDYWKRVRVYDAD